MEYEYDPGEDETCECHHPYAFHPIDDGRGHCTLCACPEFQMGYPDSEGEAFSVEEVKAMVSAFYKIDGNGVGGNLHITVDDNNIEDHHLQFCLGRSLEDNDWPAWVLGQILLKCSMRQRQEICRDHDGYGSGGAWFGTNKWGREDSDG